MTIRLLALAAVLSFAMTGCGSKGRSGEKLTGSVRIDGSSTVYPITEAIAEEFRIDEPYVKVTVGVSGTGGGFNKFIRREVDINNASRLITEKESAACEANGIPFLGMKVAYDGLAVVVNPQNTWLNTITVEEMRKMWEPAAQETITRWNQINPAWPDEAFRLYGPGIASGTYDYFTEAVVGKSGASRGDFTASEDDNVLVQGISGDKNGLGFFGLAYYEENADKLKLVGVSTDAGVVFPSAETVRTGTYKPLSRPVFIYVSDVVWERPEVLAFVNFYLDNASFLVQDVGYISLTDQEYEVERERLRQFMPPTDQPQEVSADTLASEAVNL